MSRKDDFSRVEWRRLRALPAIAYERELEAAVNELSAEVDAWRAKRINAFDLSDRIHEFHNGAARDLWKLYNGPEPPTLVASALERGILRESEVPSTLRRKFRVGAV